MEVGSRGPPGATDLGDGLPLLDFLAYTGQKGRAMSVECGISVAVVDDDCLTVAGDHPAFMTIPVSEALTVFPAGTPMSIMI